jgi:hypothetical protein
MKSSSSRTPSAPDAQPDGLSLSGTTCGFAESVYLDADGDGHGTPDVYVLCEHGFVPSGWSKSFDDCDDGDPAKFRLYNRDADGDGVGSRDQICAGAKAPTGYVVETGIPDCDDSNPTISRPYHVDADGDGVPPPNPQEVCGPKDQAPTNTVSIYVDSDPGDCDDTDATVSVLYYQDLDGDGYAGRADVSICGNPDLGPPPGFAVLGMLDCDDQQADVHPDAFELWSDSIDSDCDGRLDPWGRTCVDGGPCDAGWPTVPLDQTCGSADVVITEVQAQLICGGVWWGQIWIANQGTQPIADYVLELDSSLGHAAFAIKDALAPGSQYPYRLPEHLFPDGRPPFESVQLDGEVRFSIRAPAGNCNPTNDTFTMTMSPEPCYP